MSGIATGIFHCSKAYSVRRSTGNCIIDGLCVIVGVRDGILGFLKIYGNLFDGLGTKHSRQRPGEDDYSSQVVEDIHLEVWAE